MSHCPSAPTAPVGTAGPRSRLAACAALSGALVLSLVACGGSETGDRTAASTPSSAASTAAAGRDPYDVLEDGLQVAARRAVATSVTRAPFAAGDALNMDAALKPLDPAPVKEIRLDTTHKIIEIAPGVKFSAWTFGDQVPGPVVRARVGDRIKFTMTNRSDEPVPGVRMTAAPMMHSMDFHSAMVVAAGQVPLDRARARRSSSSSRSNYPGRVHVPLRHADGARAHRLGHVRDDDRRAARGLPDEGRPRVRDHPERVLHQARSAEAQGRRHSRSTCSTASACAPRRRPTRVFNGRYNGMVDKPLPAKPGERVRLFVLNVGPSNTSSFHVVGTIFDRVWIEGNPDNQFRGMQTVLLGSSNGAIVEFVIPEAGQLRHGGPSLRQRLARCGRHYRRGRSRRKAARAEHHNIPATAAPTDPQARAGQARFESKCLACHSIAGGDKLGPDLLRHDQAPRRCLAHALAEVTRTRCCRPTRRQGRCWTSGRCRCPTRT